MPFIARGFCLLGVAGLAAILAAGCGDNAETRPAAAPPPARPKPVAVGRVESAPPRGSVEYVGVLSAFRKADVSSELGGTVEALFFEKGDRLKQGRMMAEISTASRRIEVQQAAAALKVAESQLEKATTGSRREEILIARAAQQAAAAERLEAQNSLERVQKLYAAGALSDSAYDAAKRIADMARAKEAAARQELALAEQGPRQEDRRAAAAGVEQARAGLALARDRLRKSRLTAPFDGIAASRDVELGEVVPPGMLVARIVDLDRMKIEIAVSENDIGALKQHSELAFSIDALAGERHRCQLVFLSPAAMPATRSFPAELLVIDPDPRMADGMTVRLQVPLADAQRSVKIPTSWLAEENGAIGVYLVEDGKARFRPAVLGAYYDQRVEILEGLEGSEQVITNPAGIRTGDPVTF